MNLKFTNVLLAIALVFSAYSCKEDKKTSVVQSDFNFAEKQLTFAIQEIDSVKKATGDNSKIFPRSIENNGDFKLVSSSDWCSGFFPGQLWYLYEYTKDPKWEKMAREFTDPLEKEKYNKETHDTGFMMYCSFGNGYRLTQDPNYKEILIETANSLASRYYPNVKAIRSWDFNTEEWECPVIIDNMMNLELLYWASKETKDPKYADIATNHALTTMKNHFREDYSSFHVVDYDTITGDVRLKQTHQGFSDESAWSRGQAWGVYGYALCYKETGKKEFLDQAVKIANYIFSHKNLPEDLIPYWDFDAPNIPNEPRDVSAATVTASALYDLSTFDVENATQYKVWADKIIQNLSDNYLAPLHTTYGFLLLHSTGAKMYDLEVDLPLSYADYYFLEALLKKQKLDAVAK